MKNNLLTSAIIILLVFAGSVSFAQQNLRLAKIDSATDFQKFKEVVEARISENEKKIIELKTNKIIKDAEANIRYDNRVLALEQKNEKLKREIGIADDTTTDMWTSFKTSVNHDME